MEIERKFLVTKFPFADHTLPGKIIRQGYLAIEDQAAVRIRQAGNIFTLTAKAAIPQLSMVAREEAEIVLSKDDFETLWPLTARSRVEKVRLELAHGSHTIELDRFHGSLHGLMLAEVEFQSIAEANQFVPPEWFDREVTHEPTFTNAWISRHGNPLHAQGSEI